MAIKPWYKVVTPREDLREKLRQKIGADRIETVQKVGYRFVP